MTVKELKRVLKELTSYLNEHDDDEKIKMVSNTYFLGDCHYFLGVSGYEGGYINLEDLFEDEDEEDDY